MGHYSDVNVDVLGRTILGRNVLLKSASGRRYLRTLQSSCTVLLGRMPL